MQTELDSEDKGGRDLFALGKHLHGADGNGSPVVVICQSPEEAHHMFVTTKSREEAPVFEFISQPCGPRKLARALNLCIKRQRDSHSGRSSPAVPTRWVEMPETSHLPVDLESSDPPADRMKLSKRPTMETMGSRERRAGRSSIQEGQNGSIHKGSQPASPVNGADGVDGVNSVTVDEHQDPDHSRPSVLLVDDNDLNLQLLCAYTKKTNYGYTTARNGAEAVDVYKAHPDLFRVIILDMSMPIMDGFEAARRIRSFERKYRASTQTEMPSLTIAALTGLGGTAAQQEAEASGIDDFLTKPVKRADVHRILRESHKR